MKRRIQRKPLYAKAEDYAYYQYGGHDLEQHIAARAYLAGYRAAQRDRRKKP